MYYNATVLRQKYIAVEYCLLNAFVLLFSASLIGVKGMGSTLSCLLCLLSIVVLTLKKEWSSETSGWVVLAFILPLAINLCHFIIIDGVSGKFVEIGLRFTFPLVLIIWGSRIKVEESLLKSGMFFALMVALAWVCYKAFFENGFDAVGHNRPSNGFFNTIPFSDLVICFFTIFLAFFINADLKRTLWSWFQFFLLTVTVIAILVLTQVRGAWLALGVGVLFLIAWGYAFKLAHKLILFGSVAALVIGLYLIESRVQVRVNEAFYQLLAYFDGEVTSSVGARFEMWKAGLVMFMDNPLFGVGRGLYQHNIYALQNAGRIPATVMHYAEPHNELIFYLSEQGVIGFFSLLLLYFAPLVVFLKSALSENTELRAFSQAGCVLVIGYATCGLTSVLFLQMSLVTFYSTMVCLLISQIYRIKNQLP